MFTFNLLYVPSYASCGFNENKRETTMPTCKKCHVSLDGETILCPNCGSANAGANPVKSEPGEAHLRFPLGRERGPAGQRTLAALGGESGRGGRSRRGAFRVQSDPERRSRYLPKAAKLGDVHAMRELGVLLADGIVVGQDTKKAVEWLAKSVERGNPDALSDLGRILTPKGPSSYASPSVATRGGATRSS